MKKVLIVFVSLCAGIGVGYTCYNMKAVEKTNVDTMKLPAFSHVIFKTGDDYAITYQTNTQKSLNLYVRTAISLMMMNRMCMP